MKRIVTLIFLLSISAFSQQLSQHQIDSLINLQRNKKTTNQSGINSNNNFPDDAALQESKSAFEKIRDDSIRVKWTLDSLRLVDSLRVVFGDTTIKTQFNIDTAKTLDTNVLFDESASEFKPRERILDQQKSLKIFGSEFFRMATEMLIVPNMGPVNSEYKLGVGDEVVIQIWGDVQNTESLIVGRNGTITPTGIGQQRVAGLSVAEAKKMLIQKFSRIYSGVRNGASNATTFVDITPGNLRQKSIIVVGEVINPGNYLIPSTAGVISAIAKAGGPTDVASMRNVYIRRGGADVLDSIDLYDYFLTGKITDTTTLADFDVILVNPVGKRVSIDGAVQRPAQYELKNEETFENLFNFCGGLLPEAYTKSIVIERTIPGIERGTYTIEEEDFAKIYPENSDYILIDFIDKVNNTVSIEGAVERPGFWSFREGMKVSELINLAGGVLDDFFGDRIEILRTNSNLEREVLALNVKELLDGTSSDLELQKWDIVKVYSIWDLQYREFVEVYGEVKNPGKYFLRKGMTIQDIILLAGGFSNDAYKDTLEISRIVNTDIHTGNKVEYKRINVSTDFFKINTNELKHQDIVFVRRDSKKRPQEVIFLGGEFCFPGHYAKLSSDETLSSLIKRAGGFNKNAYLDGTIFKRSKDSVGNVAINFEALFEKDRKKEDIILEHGDSIIAPTMQKTAAVGGGVNYPTSVKFVEKKSVRYYLNQAGGLTDLGKKGTIYVVRANGEVRKVRKSNSRAVNAGTEIFVVEAEPKERNANAVISTVSATTSMMTAITTLLILLLKE